MSDRAGQVGSRPPIACAPSPRSWAARTRRRRTGAGPSGRDIRGLAWRRSAGRCPGSSGRSMREVGGTVGAFGDLALAAPDAGHDPPAGEVDRLQRIEAGAFKPALDLVVGKAEMDVGVLALQLDQI